MAESDMLLSTPQFGQSVDDQQVQAEVITKATGGHRPSARRLGFWLTVSLALHAVAFLLVFTLVPDLDLPISRQVALELVRGSGDPAADPGAHGDVSSGAEERQQPTVPVAVDTDGSNAGVSASEPVQGTVGAPSFVHVSPSSNVARPKMLMDRSSAGLEPGKRLGPQIDEQRLVASIRLEFLSWLEQHKRYPLAARRRGVEGAVLVRFVVNRDGDLLERELLKSSGSRHLDQAALELLSRASPFPELPRSLDVDRLEIELPVEYRLSDS